MRVTTSLACSKGSAFISIFVTPQSARRTSGCSNVMPSKRRSRRRTRSRHTHVVALPGASEDSDHNCRAVPVYGSDGHHPSTLAIPKSIIPSRLWPLAPLSASVPQPEVCTLDVVEDPEVDVVFRGFRLPASTSSFNCSDPTGCRPASSQYAYA
jgi:hypothetical protein